MKKITLLLKLFSSLTLIGIILYSSLIPGKEFPELYSYLIWKVPHFDKFSHVLTYFCLYLFISRITSKNVLTITIIIAVLSEILQYFGISGRSFSLADILFNLLGIFISSLLTHPKSSLKKASDKSTDN